MEIKSNGQVSVYTVADEHNPYMTKIEIRARESMGSHDGQHISTRITIPLNPRLARTIIAELIRERRKWMKVVREHERKRQYQEDWQAALKAFAEEKKKK